MIQLEQNPCSSNCKLLTISLDFLFVYVIHYHGYLIRINVL